MTETSHRLEFSRRVSIQGVPEAGRTYRFEATEGERAAVARRLDLAGVERLEAEFDVVPEGQGVLARGRFEAVVVQACVVTLQPVTSRVEGEIVQRFSPVGQDLTAGGTEIEVDALAEDPPEPPVQGAAELGELVVEHLALALDPYPRVPGVSVELPHENVEGGDNPFSKLRGLKFSATES